MRISIIPTIYYNFRSRQLRVCSRLENLLKRRHWIYLDRSSSGRVFNVVFGPDFRFRLVFEIEFNGFDFLVATAGLVSFIFQRSYFRFCVPLKLCALNLKRFYAWNQCRCTILCSMANYFITFIDHSRTSEIVREYGPFFYWLYWYS